MPEAEWLEARTPHFVIWSSLDPDETRALARELALFRALAVWGTGGSETEPAVPTYIYAFGSGPDFSSFTPRYGYGGFFALGLRDNRFAVNAHFDRRWDAVDFIKHEYVHLLLRSGPRVFPRWFDEGLAAFLATARIGDGWIEVGHAPAYLKFFRTVHWIPLGRVFAARTRIPSKELAAFYVESWALIHYLRFRRDGAHELAGEVRGYLTQEMRAYLDATGDGASGREAAERVFGLSVRKLDDALRRYVEKGSFAYWRREVDRSTAPAIAIAPVPAARMATELGWLALANGKPGQARAQFETARAAGGSSPRVLAGLAVAAHQLEEPEAARAGFDAALAAAPDDALCHLDYARYLHDLAEKADQAGDAEERSRLLASARRHYVRSWTLDDSIPEAYAMYGASFLFDGEEAARGVESLERARGLLRSNLEIELLLARAYSAVGRRYEAQELALRVAGWSHDEEQRGEAEALVDEIEAGGDVEPPPPEPL